MKKSMVIDVFTPTTPARLAFVERESLNTRLVNNLQTPGKQIIVFGHSGSGKTTLIVNKLDQVYESHIITRCFYGMSFDQVILDAFDQLSPFYIVEKTKKDRVKITANMKATYTTISSSFGTEISGEAGETQQRILPPQLTPGTLGKLLGTAGPRAR